PKDRIVFALTLYQIIPKTSSLTLAARAAGALAQVYSPPPSPLLEGKEKVKFSGESGQDETWQELRLPSFPEKEDKTESQKPTAASPPKEVLEDTQKLPSIAAKQLKNTSSREPPELSSASRDHRADQGLGSAALGRYGDTLNELTGRSAFGELVEAEQRAITEQGKARAVRHRLFWALLVGLSLFGAAVLVSYLRTRLR
ncbi:MAG: hypothetical protein VYD19_06545, partial [Myxococcota bacterium]|nr:hypothetical protein [Myxococcota bacterium]